MMFAVPGWKISPDSLATQEPSRLLPQSEQAPHPTPSSNSKKRKHDQSGQRVTAQDLDRLWKKHFGTPSSNASIAGKLESSHGTNEVATSREKAERQPVSESKPLSSVSTVGDRDDRSRKRKKTKRKPHRLDSDQPKDFNTKLSTSNSAIAPDKLGKKFVDQVKDSHISQPAAKVPNPGIQTRAMPPPPPSSIAAELTPLQAKMRHKLTSARFRHLNQTLYTTSSFDAFQLFSSSPELFGEYHAGFSQQVKDSWPQNPVNVYIRDIRERGKLQEFTNEGKNTTKLPLPRRKTGQCVIADLGCGDAPLARGCQSQIKTLQLKFYNYDLHAPNSFVTKADIANLPLRDGQVDVAVFCLSLMGSNWIDFIEEAWRVLRADGKGEVWVAEVKSRFGRVKPKVVENSVGKKKKVKKLKVNSRAEDENRPINGQELFAEDDQALNQEADATDISAFLDVFQRRGFSLRQGSVDRSNKMFISAVFTKAGMPTAGKYKGWKWTGREYEKNTARHSGRMKFLDKPEDEVLPKEEARVLKPCVYKAR